MKFITMMLMHLTYTYLQQHDLLIIVYCAGLPNHDFSVQVNARQEDSVELLGLLFIMPPPTVVGAHCTLLLHPPSVGGSTFFFLEKDIWYKQKLLEQPENRGS